MELMVEDCNSFDQFLQAKKLDKSDNSRTEKIVAAIRLCISIPQEIAAVAIAVLEELNKIKDKINPYLLGDLGVASALCCACVKSCNYLVSANLTFLKSKSEIEELRNQSQKDQQKAAKLFQSMEDFLKSVFNACPN